MGPPKRQQDYRPEEAAADEHPSQWGSIGVRALIIANTVLLVVIVAVVTLSFVLSSPSTAADDGTPEEQARGDSINEVARRGAILELEMDGIAQEQELDENAFQTACTDFFSHALLAQEENYENIECEIVSGGRNLLAVNVRDYRIIRAAVYGDGPSSINDFQSLLHEIVREGGDDFVARLVRASQMFQSLTSIKAREDSAGVMDSATVAPSSAATTIRETIAQTIGSERLEQSGPYQDALDWISVADPKQLDALSPNLLQRYVAAYLYYATGPWTVCGPAETVTEKNCFVTGTVGTSHGGIMATQSEEIRWLSSDTECNWYGIECNERSQIVQITLDKVGLSGTFPDGIHFFEHLQELSLTRDSISGPLPVNSLAQAMNLVSLNLAGQPIEATFVDAWEACKTISSVNFDYTSLVGPLEIPESPNLIERFSATGNGITGTLSPTIRRATNLKSLSLNWNALSGPIPSELYTLSNLEVLSLSSNSIDGTIGAEIGGMNSLQTFNLSWNNLTGPLAPFPENLRELNLMYNGGMESSGLNGTLSWFPQSLELLMMSGNAFSGSVPDSIFRLTKLTELALASNELSGTISPMIGQLTALTYLRLNDNSFTSTIPAEISTLTELNLADFSLNNFTGALDFCSAENLGSDCLPDVNNSTAVYCPCCSWCCNSTSICFGRHIDDPLCNTDESGTYCV